MPRQPDQLGGEVQPGGADQLAQNTIELASGLASEMAAPAAEAEAANGQPTMTSGTLQAAAGSHPAAAAAAAAAAGPGLSDSDLFVSTRFSPPASSNSSVCSSVGSGEEGSEEGAVLTRSRPDQHEVSVRTGTTDQLYQDVPELAAGLASKMAAPAVNVEAADGLSTSTTQRSSQGPEEEVSPVTTDPSTLPAAAAGGSRADMLQQLAVGDGNTQGGGSYMLNESEITPPNPRRTGSDAATLLAPVLADYDERMGKIESAVAGITASQQLAQQQQQAMAETTGAQMAQILTLLTQKNQAANSPTTEISAAMKIAPAPAPQRSLLVGR